MIYMRVIVVNMRLGMMSDEVDSCHFHFIS